MNALNSAAATAPADAVLVARAPLGHFAPSLTNRKHTPAHVTELAKSIKADGIAQPITARPWPASRGKAPKGVLYEIVIGEGRWLGAGEAGETEIPFFWRDLNDEQALKLQLVENLKRKDLTEIEEAEGYRRLMKDHGYTADRVADEIDKSRSHVYGRLKLLDLSPGALAMVQKHKLEATIAVLIARIPDPKLQEQAAKEIACGRWGNSRDPMPYRAAAEHVQLTFMLKLAEAPFSRADTDLLPGVGRCHDCAKRTGNARELYEDVKSADVCTDPTCYHTKAAAHAKRQQELAKAEGRKVIKGEEAKKLKPHSYSDVAGGYVELDKTVYVDGKAKTVRQVLGAEVPKADLLVDPHKDGKLIEVLPVATIRDQLEAKGVLRDVTGGRVKSEKEKAKQKAEKLREKIETTFSQRLFDQIRSHLVQDINDSSAPYLEPEEERMVLQRLFELTSYALQIRVARTWFGPAKDKAKDYDLVKELEERIAGMDRKDVAKLMLDLTLIGEAGQTRAPERMLEIAKHMAIDADALKVEIRKELAPKDAPAKKAKVQPGAAKAAEDALQVGDRVRVKEGVKGPTKHLRKCCGREGIVSAKSGTKYSVKFDVSPGKESEATGFARADLEKLPPATTAEDLGPIGIGDRVRIKDNVKSVIGSAHIGKTGTTTHMVGKAFMVEIDKSKFSVSYMPDELEKLPATAASTPSNAAQAEDKGAAKPAAPAKANATKKPKAKANPAPATRANEPATPAKTTTLNPASAWPFPTASKPMSEAQKLEAAGQTRMEI